MGDFLAYIIVIIPTISITNNHSGKDIAKRRLFTLLPPPGTQLTTEVANALREMGIIFVPRLVTHIHTPKHKHS